MSDGARESWFGRAWVLVTLLVVFLSPIWVMIAAGIMQVFPEVVGYDIVWNDIEERRVFTMRSWLIGGTLSGVVVAAFMLVLSFIGGGSLVARVLGRMKDRSDQQKYRRLAGEVVVSGVELKTTTVVRGEEPPTKAAATSEEVRAATAAGAAEAKLRGE